MDHLWEKFFVSGKHNLSGYEFEDQAVLIRLINAEFDNKIYQFPSFNVSMLFLFMAKEAEEKAIELCKKIQSMPLDGRTVDKKKKYTLYAENPNDILEYFRQIYSAYIFSLCALEGYVNLRVDSFQPTDDDYAKLDALVKEIGLSAGLVERKTDLIRHCSIEQKVLHIIPHILAKKGIHISILSHMKNELKLIISIRNSLMHFNRMNARTGQLEDGRFETKTLWNYTIPKFTKDSVSLKNHPAKFISKLIDEIETAYKAVTV